MKINAALALKLVHLVLAVLYLAFVTFGMWAKRGDPDQGVFSADGGSGFGLVCVVLGVVVVALALMRLAGRSTVLPGLGVEQLTVIVGLAATLNLLAFIVGWLAVFPAGTGWGVPAAYFPASIIPQIGLLTLSAQEPATGISALGDTRRRLFGMVALCAGAGIALFGFLPWLTAGDVSLSAFDGRSGNPTSGPRFGYMLLILGAVVVVASLMRLRPRGLAEPGPNALLSHAALAIGFGAFVVTLSTLISVVRVEATLNPGIGLWLGLIASIALMGVALAENRVRHAVGV